jgi:membrane fusion protein, multidrug efflux system
MADRDPPTHTVPAPDAQTRPMPESAKPVRRRSAIWAWLIWLLVLGGIGYGGWYWLQNRQVPEAAAGRFNRNTPMPVSAATVERGDLPVTIAALGTVTPMQVVTIRPQVSGRLTKIGFQEGQTVKEGDFLAEIDPRGFQAALEQAEGQLQRDQALLRNAEIDLARYRTLVQQDSMARQQRDTQEALVRQYQGTVKTDQALVDSARVNLSYTRITSPLNGRVGLRLVDQGNYVQAGDATGIVVISQVKPITVSFAVPEDNVPAITRQLRAGVTLPVTVYDRSRTTVLGKGQLVSMDNQIDTSTGTVKIKAQFDNAEEALFPNQFVNVELLVDTLRDKAVLPVASVQRGAPGTFVYLINPDSTVAVKPIKVGRTEGERVMVESGLEIGTRVVADGADRLRDGARIIVLEGGRAPGGGAGVTGEGPRTQRRPRSP